MISLAYSMPEPIEATKVDAPRYPRLDLYGDQSQKALAKLFDLYEQGDTFIADVKMRVSTKSETDTESGKQRSMCFDLIGIEPTSSKEYDEVAKEMGES